MLRTTVSAGLIVCMAGAGFCQSTAPPSFEVASVKPAPPPTGMGIRVMMNGGPGSGDPGRLNWSNVALRQMITKAYGIKDYQLSAPEWIASARFDVVAKMPPDTTDDQFNAMLQGLLAERFGLKIHREQKELPMYALVVGKNGPKLKESTENSTLPGMMGRGGPMGGPPPGAARGVADGYGAPPPPPPPSGSGSKGASGPPDSIQTNSASNTGGGRGGSAGGATSVAPKAGRGGMMMMGRGHLAAAKMGIAGLADNLTRLLARPVLDMTGLTGQYDFSLDWTPDENERPMIPGMPMPMPGGGGGEVHSDAAPGATLFTAVQEQLGLKLEPRKAPVELIVIDHAERVPAEN